MGNHTLGRIELANDQARWSQLGAIVVRPWRNRRGVTTSAPPSRHISRCISRRISRCIPQALLHHAVINSSRLQDELGGPMTIDSRAEIFLLLWPCWGQKRTSARALSTLVCNSRELAFLTRACVSNHAVHVAQPGCATS